MAYSRAWWRDGNEVFTDDLDLWTMMTVLSVLSLGPKGARRFCLVSLSNFWYWRWGFASLKVRLPIYVYEGHMYMRITR